VLSNLRCLGTVIILSFNALLMAEARTAPDANPERLSIQIDGYGFCRVLYEDLDQVIDPAGIDPGSIVLELRGAIVPVLVLAGDDGTFDRGDSIVFFAEDTGCPYAVSQLFTLVMDAPQNREARILRHPEPPPDGISSADAGDLASALTLWTYRFLNKGPKIDVTVLLPALGDEQIELAITPDNELSLPLSLMVETPNRQRQLTVSEPGPIVLSYDKILDGFKEGRLWLKIDLPQECGGYELEVFARVKRDNRSALPLSIDQVPALIFLEGFPRDRYYAYDIDAQRLLWTQKRFDERGCRLGILVEKEESQVFIASPQGMQRPTRVALAAPPSRERERLESIRADYLAIAPRRYLNTLVPYLAYRDGDVGPACSVALEDIYGAYSKGQPDPQAIEAYVRALAQGSGTPPRYLLLVGAAREKRTAGREPYYRLPADRFDSFGLLPPCAIENPMRRSGPSIPVDTPYGDLDADGIPEIAVGRIPCRTVDELDAALQKIYRYETEGAAPSLRVFLQAGLGRFDTSGGNEMMGTMLENMLERLARGMVDRWIPKYHPVDVLYSASSSDYFYAPSIFRDKVVDELNEGYFAAFYMGHGNVTRYDVFSWRDRRYPTFDAADAGKVSIVGEQGPYFSLTCLSGTLARKLGERCLAEVLFINPRGPSAAIAGSGEVDETGNFLMMICTLKALFQNRVERVGDLLVQVKMDLHNEFQNDEHQSLISMLETIMASGVPVEERIGLARNQFNLFGDPAMRIRYPEREMTLEASGGAVRGDRLELSGTTAAIKAGEVRVTLELPRNETLKKIRKPKAKTSDAEAEAIYTRNHRLANDRVVLSKRFSLVGGRFSGLLEIPTDLETRKVVIKAHAVGEGRHAVAFIECKVVDEG